MTVVLIGVGVDSENASPYPQISEDGQFEYVPIPEAHSTSEDQSYDSLARRHEGGSLELADDSDETLADTLDYIKPTEDDGNKLTDAELEAHAIHHDPNFSALTYGEVKTANRNQIAHLSPDKGDILAFYTGLTKSGSTTPHRFIIGYFTVEEIIDFSEFFGPNPPLNHNERVVVDDLSDGTREQVEKKLYENQDNAHTKRYQASGSIDPNLMIVNGREPGRLLEKAYRISQTVPGGHGFTAEFENSFNVQTTKDGRDTGWLGGFKKAHRLGISGDEFTNQVSE
jgi:hypothetical protein